jgi:hypothetical protein
MAWTGHVIDRIRIRMMVSVIRDPGARGTRTIEDREKNQDLLDNRVEFYSTMRESPMIADRRAEAAGRSHCKSAKKDFPAR